LNLITKFIPENNRLERIWKIAQVDFKSRYYNDKLGLLWAFINPTIKVLIYYIIFSIFFKRSIEGIDNFALFLFSGIIFWMPFVEISKKSMRILLTKRYLIENIKLNKEDLFISNTLSGLLGFTFNVFALLLIGIFMQINISLYLFYIPILILNILMISMGFGMILSCLYVFFKDVIHLLDIFFLLGFWGSGIFFKSDLILENIPLLYYLNPFVGILHNVRETLIFEYNIDLMIMSINLIQGILIMLLGFKVLQNFSSLALERF